MYPEHLGKTQSPISSCGYPPVWYTMKHGKQVAPASGLAVGAKQLVTYRSRAPLILVLQ